MIKYKIIDKDGLQMPFSKAVKLLDLEPYDPWGQYSEKSDAYIASVLTILKKEKKIKKFEITGDMKPIPNVEGRVY